MNKKIIAGLMITATFLSTTSLASNESKKLETLKNFDLKIDEQIDKNNLKDEIVLQNGVRLKFDEKGNLIEYDALNITAKIRTRSVDANFEDYLNSTISKLQKDGYIPKEYKLVDKQDILDNGYKVVFEKENSFNVKNPYNIITVSFDKKTNELKTFNKIEKFEVTKDRKSVV